MIGQVTVPVATAKRLIARAIYELPAVQAARRRGKIALKSGSTVSALAELFGLPPLRLGGRIAPDGARAAKAWADAPHLVVIEDGNWRRVDDSLLAELAAMGPEDVFITGANALDCHGVAGLMAGLAGGSMAGQSLGALYSEGVQTIIAVGLEKLIPGSIVEICQLAGRKRIAKSMGMAVGLMPLFGRVVTEKDALEILTGVRAAVIGAGGIEGAEGATTLLVEGTANQVDAVFKLIAGFAGCGLSGDPESVPSCGRGGPGCKGHLGCIHRQGGNE